MATRTKSGRFTGVYSRESANKRFRGRPDRCFEYTYRDRANRKRWVKVGWASEGITEALASQLRAERIRQARHGADPALTRGYTVDNALTDYLDWAEGEGKAVRQERNRYEQHIKPHLDRVCLTDLSEDVLDGLKRQLLREKTRSGKPRSPQTVHHVFSLLRRAINRAIRRKRWAGTNPISVASDFTVPRPNNTAERFLTPDEAQALLDALALRSQSLADMSRLSLQTGLRSTEIFGLRGRDIDPEAGLIWLTAKGGQRQKVLAGSEVLAMLAENSQRPQDYIFPARGGGRRKQISKVFGLVVNGLGMNDGIDDKRQQVWFHTWRHTFASWLAQSGKVSLFELKELMRHESIDMTMRYAHLIPDRRREKLAVIRQRLGGATGPDRPSLKLAE